MRVRQRLFFNDPRQCVVKRDSNARAVSAPLSTNPLKILKNNLRFLPTYTLQDKSATRFKKYSLTSTIRTLQNNCTSWFKRIWKRQLVQRVIHFRICETTFIRNLFKSGVLLIKIIRFSTILSKTVLYKFTDCWSYTVIHSMIFSISMFFFINKSLFTTN